MTDLWVYICQIFCLFYCSFVTKILNLNFYTEMEYDWNNVWIFSDFYVNFVSLCASLYVYGMPIAQDMFPSIIVKVWFPCNWIEIICPQEIWSHGDFKLDFNRWFLEGRLRFDTIVTWWTVFWMPVTYATVFDNGDPVLHSSIPHKLLFRSDFTHQSQRIWIPLNYGIYGFVD
jgi:hypothetical protein